MTTIPAVLAALAALGTATLPNSQVINGPFSSVTSTTGRVLVIGGDPEQPITGDVQLDSMAVDTSNEIYMVPLLVSVSIPGTDQTAADALALTDWAAMKAAIREYPGGADLGLSAQGVRSVLPIGPFQIPRQATENGRATAIRFAVQVIAQTM